MSIFGKLGVGGKLPGNFPGGPNETPVDLAAAETGTDIRTPDSKSEYGAEQNANHNAA